MSKYDVARWDELDGVVKKVRRALGVTAFGVNYFDLPPGAEGPDTTRRRRTRRRSMSTAGLGPAAGRRQEIEVGEGMAVRDDRW